ncbi:hypothetical protein OEA41_005813 [Lepraria neglecta]|uniref:WD40 repeat-like protein n=1 Tax=Lepraria neglecta TaxID=209136 RepID=A0AAD9Z7R7_9LECA|nr:hypothetical protein OEA41_005813 [Lepraria neglecta]
MPTSQSFEPGRGESPDPASHAANIYDTTGTEGEWEDERDDDDMDFEPTTDESEDAEFFDPTEDVEADFHVPTQLMQLLGNAGLRRMFANRSNGDRGITLQIDEDELDDGIGILGSRRRRRARSTKNQFPAVPSEVGQELMDGGVFGTSEYYRDSLRKRNKRLARKLMSRELGNDRNYSTRATSAVSQGMIPSSNADTIIHYNSRCYSGQFSEDGNFFFSCAQDFKVRMYDTSNPYNWKYYKTVLYPFGQWTITDASLSPDNKWLAYSSIRSIVCLAPTDPSSSGDPFLCDFSDMGGRRGGRRRGFHGGYSHFGIWSIRFSGDGREIVAGTSDHSVYVYDLETRQSILSIPGHNNDVNAVCFGDQSSPHILYSGSDDTTIKVWDRRSMGDSREAGVFMGHTEGLTYVDSKGDGRYVLSNGKDQTMKLWDLRKMMPTEKASSLDPARYTTSFDYRFMTYDEKDYVPHPHDCSLVTFRGHRVLKTLIRCHFSPPGSTNSRYVYSGSEDGSVYIYNLDATLAGKVDVNQATHHSRPRDPDLYMSTYAPEEGRSRGSWKTCVRDASWHPNAPVIAATSWNGWGMSTGTCTTHSWNDGAEDDEGEPKMGLRVNQRLEVDDDLYDNPSRGGGPMGAYRSRLRSRRVPAAGDDDDGPSPW